MWNSSACYYCTIGVVSAESNGDKITNDFAPLNNTQYTALWNLNP